MGVITITKDNFDKEVLQSDKTVLLDFWAGWCAPCRILSPVVDDFAEGHSEIKVCKVNVDEQSELAMKYKVMSIPTLVVIKNGELADKSVGVVSMEEIESMVQ